MKINLGDLSLTSSAFAHGRPIRDKYTVRGAGFSPPLRWDNVPNGAGSIAVMCHDPDAPLTRGFVHWVLYNIPADAAGLDENTTLYTVGTNDAGIQSYLPPAPPPGHGDHFYYFHVYALAGLDAPLGAALTGGELLDVIDERIIEQARIVGTFRRYQATGPAT